MSRTFWLLFAILVTAPLYPIGLFFWEVAVFLYESALEVYYWKWPETRPFKLDEPQIVKKSVHKTRTSYSEYPMPRSGPAIRTQKVN